MLAYYENDAVVEHYLGKEVDILISIFQVGYETNLLWLRTAQEVS